MARSSVSEDNQSDGHVFLPGKDEALYGRLRLRYSSGFNEYYSGTNEITTSKSKAIANSLESAMYSCDNVRRTIDSITEEVYIERNIKEQNARAVWRFNFAPCGLALDRLTMKMSYEESGGGQVAVSVSGDPGSPSVMYHSSDVYMTITRLEGSSTLTISVNMIGENRNHVTRIMSEGFHASHIDYPLDIQIRMKRPDFTIGRSLIFIGLMHSKKEPTNTKVKPKKRGKTKDASNDRTGYLNIFIHKAKRLPCRENGTYAEPKVKCTLHGNGTSLKVKSHPAGKILNPTWNERLVISNVTFEQLSYSQLELQVVHTKSMFKLKSTETLGYAVLQLQNVVGTWKKPLCRNNSLCKSHEIHPSLKQGQEENHQELFINSKKVSTISTLTSTSETQPRPPSEDNSFCIMPNDSHLFDEDNSQGILHRSSSIGSLNSRIKSISEGISNMDSMLSDTDTATEEIVENKESAHEINTHNIKTNVKQKPFLCERAASFTSGSIDSEVENITYRDLYYRQFLSKDVCSPSKVSDVTDESFEILNSFRQDSETLQHSKADSDFLKNTKNENYIDIQNTIGESEIDHIHNDHDRELEEIDNIRLNKLERADNDTQCNSIDVDSVMDMLQESRVDPQTEEEEESGPEQTFVYRPKSSLKRSKSYSEQLRDVFKAKLNNARSTTNITLETSDDTTECDDSESQNNSVIRPESLNMTNVGDFTSSTIDDKEIETKRRTVSVDNSQLTPSGTRRFQIDSNNTFNSTTRQTRKKPVGVKRSHSFSDLIDINRKREKKFNKRRNFSSKLYRSGSVSNILDDFFEEKAKVLSHEHWNMVANTPEQWFYGWHPLLGVNNLLSNW